MGMGVTHRGLRALYPKGHIRKLVPNRDKSFSIAAYMELSSPEFPDLDTPASPGGQMQLKQNYIQWRVRGD